MQKILKGPWKMGVDDWRRQLRAVLPGLLLAVMVATAATYVAQTQGAPVMLVALLLGMAMNSVADNENSQPGIRFAASTVLKFGVAFLGLRISLGEIAQLGWITGVIVIVGVVGTIALGIALARMFGLSRGFGVISGVATAICGASAALAVSSVLPKGEAREADTVLTVTLVTSLSTLAMVFYPGLTVMLGLSDHQAGVLFGSTIHDVAQVVGAGYAISDEAGDTATIVKLFRVVLLVPAVLVIGWGMGRGAAGGTRFPLPPFAVGFALLVLLNSVLALPEALTATFDSVSRWCLVTAVAALGMRTSLRDLVNAGPKPLLSVIAATIGLLLFILLCLQFGLL